MGLLGKQQSSDPRATDSSIRVRTGDLRDSEAERDDFCPICLEKRTSVAEAVNRAVFFGTAEAVPFVKSLFPIWVEPSPTQSVRPG
jgi:hypothetical protein